MKTTLLMGCVLQRLRPQRFLPLLAIGFSFVLPSKLGGTKFIPIYDSLTIRAQKNSPPHIAFESLYEIKEKEGDTQWNRIEKKSSVTLATHQPGESIRTPVLLFAKKVVLPEMVLQKNSEVLIAEAESFKDLNERSWTQELSSKQLQRLELAQSQSDIANKDWRPQSFTELAREAIEKYDRNTLPAKTPKYTVMAKGPGGEIKNQVPASSIDWDGSQTLAAAQATASATNGGAPSPDNFDGGASPFGAMGSGVVGKNLKVVGPLEITGGLAVTNDHHFEIRRNDRGIYKELGKVDLVQGLYNIEVDDISGTVVARLVNKEGKILGEGSFRLGLATQRKNDVVIGPKIKIAPHTDYSGTIAGLYSTASDPAPAQTRVSFVNGASDVAVKRDGAFAMDNVVKKSSTVMRAMAPNHLQTSAIIISGQEFKAQLFPEKMIAALQSIVFEERDTKSSEAKTAQIIWGKAELDGKPVAGIEVQNENDPSLTPVYFNQFMIPDLKLKATSENGLFAFVGAEEGFQSIIALRGGSIFGYQNVVVEPSSVAQADISSTIRKEAVAVSVFDAFLGEPQSATIELQSLDEIQDITSGVSTLMLPPIARLGVLKATPMQPEYSSARYLYSDSDAFIHVPLIRSSWLTSIRSYLRLDDKADVGTVVGFVPDEDFEVYLAGHDNFDSRNIVYFDMQGRILQTGKGVSGGGFILYNVPADTHEVVVLGQKSHKMYSKVIPVDDASLSVLSFQE